MAIGNGSTELKITLNAEGVVTGIKAIESAQEDLTKSSEQAAEGFGSFGGAAVVLNQGLELAEKAIGAVSEAFQALGEAVDKGAKINDVTESFDKLAAKAGTLGDTALANLRDAVAGTVSDFDLMQSANKALLAGLKPDDFNAVATAARAYADQVGGDTLQSIEALTQAVQTGSDRALKQFGIIVDNNKAFADYAAKIGVAADSLSELGKAEALRAASLQALKDNTEKIGKATLDVGDRYDALKVSLSNVFDQVQKAIGTNEDLGKAFDQVNASIKAINWKEVAADISAVISGIAQLTSKVIDAIGALSKLGPIIKAAFLGAGGALTEFGKAEDSAAAHGKAVFEAHAKLIQQRLDLEKVTKQSTAATTIDTQAMVDQKLVAENAAKALKDMNDALDKQAQEFKKLNSLDGVKEFAGQVDSLIGTYKEGLITQKQLNDGLDDMELSTAAAGANADTLAGIIDNRLGKALDGLDKNLDKVDTSFASAFKDIGKFNGNTLGTDLMKSIGDGLSVLLSGNGFGLKEGKALGADFGKGIADAFGLGPIGESIGAALGSSIANSIHDIFGGGGNADTDARKQVDKFFSDMFDTKRLKLVIDGQLKDVFDLDFGGSGAFNAPGWDDFLNSLGTDAKQAFDGVGQAFNELLGTGQDIGSQLASVFADNVGGSLNNLQILVEATGKSFDDLSKGVVQAFEEGKLSFIEAQDALVGIQDIAQKGIPGAVGATVEAFNNLIAAGIKGGRVSVDALGDLGAEALELGEKTLPELQAQLIASGQFTANDIQTLFNTLANQGITSLEQLRDATAEQLIPVLSELQANGFSFADVASNQIDNLISKLDDLPSEKNIVLNVSANVSDQAQKVIAAVGPGQA